MDNNKRIKINFGHQRGHTCLIITKKSKATQKYNWKNISTISWEKTQSLFEDISKGQKAVVWISAHCAHVVIQTISYIITTWCVSLCPSGQKLGSAGADRAGQGGQAKRPGKFRIWFSGHGFQDLGSQLWGLDFHTRGFQDRNLKTFRTWFLGCGISILGPGFHTGGFTVAFGHRHPLVYMNNRLPSCSLISLHVLKSTLHFTYHKALQGFSLSIRKDLLVVRICFPQSTWKHLPPLTWKPSTIDIITLS